MNTQFRILLVGIALCALPLTVHANAPRARTQEKPTKPALNKDEAALIAVAEAQAERIRKRDIEGYMKYYARRDDLSIYDAQGEDAILGWDACHKHWEEQMADVLSVDKLQLSKLRAHVLGDMGYLTATWTIEITTRDGDKFSQTGRLTDVFQKLDGKWLIVHEHNSVPLGNGANADKPDVEENEVQYPKPEKRGDGKSGIQGIAMIGPISPVERVGVPNTRPFPDAIIAVQSEPDRTEVARQKVNPQGKFRIALVPGTYRLIALPPKPGVRLPRGSEQVITVHKGEFASVEAGYDSGIR